MDRRQTDRQSDGRTDPDLLSSISGDTLEKAKKELFEVPEKREEAVAELRAKVEEIESTVRRTDRQSNGQADRQTDRRTDRQSDGQTLVMNGRLVRHLLTGYAVITYLQ